jgi:hypothetical protein
VLPVPGVTHSVLISRRGHKKMRRKLVCGMAAILAVLGVAGVGIGSAVAATTPKGGPIGLFAKLNNGPSGSIVVAGAIGDHGTILNVDKDGKPSQNGNFVKVTLEQGTFELNVTAVNKMFDTTRPQLQSGETCSIGFIGSAPVKLLNGTGLYTGISGTANVTATFAGVGSRYKSGAKKGQCDQSNSAPLLAQFSMVVGRGTVRFS